MIDRVVENLKNIADGISIGIIATTLVGWLPPLAAAVSIAWTVYQWYHSPLRKARIVKEKEDGLR